MNPIFIFLTKLFLIFNIAIFFSSCDQKKSHKPKKITKNYCNQNKLAVERRVKNELTKRTAQTTGYSLASCGTLVFIFGGLDLGGTAALCGIVTATVVAIDIETYNEEEVIEDIYNQYFDRRCLNYHK